jgi:hypothetical protein
MNELVKKYIKSLDQQELLIFNLAKQHLKTSFDIEKSIGFIKWKKKNNID